MPKYIEEGDVILALMDAPWWNDNDEDVAYDALDSVRAADVEKVRHGEWIMHTNSEGNLNHYECSECHMCQGHISNFCEECGAKMDGGKVI